MPRPFNEKKTIFSTKPNIHIQKNEDEPLPYTIYKYQFQRIKDLNVKIKPIKLLEDNIGGNLHNNGFKNGFMNMTTKSTGKKVKIDNILKIKKLCTSKDTISRVKR